MSLFDDFELLNVDHRSPSILFSDWLLPGTALLAAFARSRIAKPGSESIAPPIDPAYVKPTAKAKEFELKSPATILDEEYEETLAAIDEGIRDAEAGRTTPAEEVRKRLPKWITASSTRKGR